MGLILMINRERYIEILFIAEVNKILETLKIKDYSLIFKLYWTEKTEMLNSIYNKLIHENNYLIGEIVAFKKEFERADIIWGYRRISKFFNVPEIKFIEFFKKSPNIVLKQPILETNQLQVISTFLNRLQSVQKNITLKGIEF